MGIVVSSHFIEKNLPIIVGAILTERLSKHEDCCLRKFPLYRCSDTLRKGRLDASCSVGMLLPRVSSTTNLRLLNNIRPLGFEPRL